ncbi:MAG: hypothetical protein LBI77_02345 [Puniceicoccales bacterium]|nr:hypothetical protein [Puniceicoccales bacterium]
MLPTIHVIDFEGNRSHGIMEYGLVTLENNRISDIFHGNCCGDNSFGVVPWAEHSRFQKKMAHPSFGKQLNLFKKKRKCGFFCAHNATLEDRLLRRYHFLSMDESGEGNRPSKDNESHHFFAKTLAERKIQAINAPIMGRNISWGPWIDTHKIYRKYYPMVGSYSLGKLVRHFRLEEELERLVAEHNFGERLTFHRAPYDAIATALLLQNFIDLFRVQDIDFLICR